MNTKTAVILAAGKGARLDRPDHPKALVKVGNKPMILWGIEQLQDAGVEQIYIVVGFRGEEIKKELTNNPDIEVEINYIHQEDSSKQGMLKSLSQVFDTVPAPFFVSMADLIVRSNPFLLFEDIGIEGGSVVSLIGENQEKFVKSGALSRVFKDGNNIKNLGRDLLTYNGLEVGIYHFSELSVNLSKGLLGDDTNIASFGEFLQKLAEDKKLKSVSLDDCEWFDINTPAVHIRAEMFIRRQQNIVTPSVNREQMTESPLFSNFYRHKKMETDIVVEPGLVSKLDKVRIIPESMADSMHFIITDSKVDSLYGEKVLQSFLEAGYNVKKLVIPEGESSKNIHEYIRLADEIFSYGMDKKSILISLGGGVVNNMAGFLASTLYRGVGLIHIPTTVMAQLDAAIDFKQAVNSTKGKNLMGSYHPAMIIVIDPEVLKTLDERYVRDGISESIKHALVQDQGLLDYLLDYNGDIKDIRFLEEVVRKTIQLKVPLLIGDVKDDHNEMLPQYGHSVGHAIEHLSSYDFLHGEALAIGMCVIAEISRLLDFCDDSLVDLHYNICKQYDLPTVVPEYMTSEDICNKIKYDKHHVKTNPHMALLIDRGEVWHDGGVHGVPIDYAILKRAIEINKSRTKL